MKLYHLDWERSAAADPDLHLEMVMDLAPEEAYAKAFEAGLYVHVADIDGDGLDRMFAETNNVEGPAWNLAPAEGIRPAVQDRPLRSTSVGDVVERDGRLLVVGRFRDIGAAPEAPGPRRAP